MTDTKIIVLDDLTGSQPVHGCLLLTRWDVATLLKALDDRSPMLSVLTDTRAMEARRPRQSPARFALTSSSSWRKARRRAAR